MKLLRGTLAVLLLLCLSSHGWGAMALAVADFKVNGLPFYLGSAVSEVIRTELVGIPDLDLVIIDGNHVKKAAQEQKLGMSGLVEPETAAKVGKVLGARYVLVGSVNSLGGESTIESRLVDVQTSVILESFSSSSNSGEEGLIEAARLIADDVKLILTGE